MPVSSGNTDVETASNATINPQSNNPVEIEQTTTLGTTDNGGVGEDGFELSIDLTTANVDQPVNIAIVIDQSGSTANSSGTDFDGDGTDDTILEGQLFAAQELFDAYIDAGYDPSEITISVVSYTSTATERGTFRLDEPDDFAAALQDISDEGPLFATNYVAALNAIDGSFTTAGAEPDDTNVIVFMSDGFPFPGGQDIAGAASDLEDDWNVVISGVGIGANSSLDALNELDNTASGATQVLSGAELLAAVVEPLNDADFLRFEITIEGVDANGDPITQTIVLPEGDPNVTTTQLGWSVDCLPIDPAFVAPQDISVTFSSYFAEDPGNPGSGEQVITTSHDVPLVVCFVAGTRILTPTGPVRVEDLVPGDRVVTRDRGVQTLRWLGARTLSPAVMRANPNLCPVLIRKDAMGAGLPGADLRVSRQHRILVRDWRAEVMFGAGEGVLVPAFSLCNDGAVRRDVPQADVTYVHLAFDQHEVVYAEGLETESFHPMSRTVSAMEDDQRDELFRLFPELEGPSRAAYGSARPEIRGPEARVLHADPMLH